MTISVIVPVYNVEKYLEQCLNSIIGQSYQDLEIILINDGSTDQSGGICDEFAKRDHRIKVIHQLNGGVSVARNVGIEISTGEYITFVDSDDWLELVMYETMINQLKQIEAIDMLMCDTILIKHEEKIKITEIIRSGYYSKAAIISELYPTLIVKEDFGKIPIVSTWNLLISRIILTKNNIRFDPALRYSEDYLFMANVVLYIESFYYVKGFHFYNYRQYDVSRSKLIQSDWWINLISLNNKLRNLLSENKDSNFDRQLKLQLIHSVLFVTGSIFKNELIGASEKVSLIKKLFKEPEVSAAFTNLDFDKQSLPLKLVLFLVRHQMAASYLIYRTIISKIKT